MICQLFWEHGCFFFSFSISPISFFFFNIYIYLALCSSDGENVPEAAPQMRPSRRAKTAALEKTKLDLNPLINQEANVS